MSAEAPPAEIRKRHEEKCLVHKVTKSACGVWMCLDVKLKTSEDVTSPSGPFWLWGAYCWVAFIDQLTLSYVRVCSRLKGMLKCSKWQSILPKHSMFADLSGSDFWCFV